MVSGDTPVFSHLAHQSKTRDGNGTPLTIKLSSPLCFLLVLGAAVIASVRSVSGSASLFLRTDPLFDLPTLSGQDCDIKPSMRMGAAQIFDPSKSSGSQRQYFQPAMDYTSYYGAVQQPYQFLNLPPTPGNIVHSSDEFANPPNTVSIRAFWLSQNVY